ncbi:MAG: SMC-Scp complex subunit ScpB [Gammaproteobacteria bacterium]|nr:SMC-Scp complex subunit ScpB [Gammaproteobacteria bacterium]
MNNITVEKLQAILEAAIFAAGRPLPIAHMQKLFDEGKEPSVNEIKNALVAITDKYQQNGIELKEVASGYQFQARMEYSHWLSRLWEERAPRYSRAFLETLALIAYRQPITRAEIEEVRGVTASSNIIKTLQEREWIRILGYKEIPGKPALYGTTKTFLDYFNLKSLDELPTLSELKDLASQEAKLQLEIDFANEKAPPAETNIESEISSNSEKTPDAPATIELEAQSDFIETSEKYESEQACVNTYNESNTISTVNEVKINEEAISAENTISNKNAFGGTNKPAFDEANTELTSVELKTDTDFPENTEENS